MQDTVYSIQYTIYSIQYTLCHVQCTDIPIHRTVDWPLEITVEKYNEQNGRWREEEIGRVATGEREGGRRGVRQAGRKAGGREEKKEENSKGVNSYDTGSSRRVVAYYCMVGGGRIGGMALLGKGEER